MIALIQRTLGAAFPHKSSVSISFQIGKSLSGRKKFSEKKFPMALVAWQPLPLPLC